MTAPGVPEAARRRLQFVHAELGDREFDRLRALIHAETGILLRDTKRPLVAARLARRLRHLGYTTFVEYCAHLSRLDPDGSERVAMVNAITTTKTDFFREPHHFAILRTAILPDVGARVRHGGPARLRVWSAGCATGEEPYSIAITILDSPLPTASWDVRILASDINTDVLARAEAGVYPEERLLPIDAGVRRHHFRRAAAGADAFEVSADARRLVTFRRVNLCDEGWPIHTMFDVIFCRNVIIYFDRAKQIDLVRRLIGFLAPGGYLILGHSESLLGHGLGLSYVGQTVYRASPTNGLAVGPRRGDA
jgi:chemotaxis protein methyltransferase CheR